MKKLIAVFLALMMILSLTTVAFAAEEGDTETPSATPTTGSITINGTNASAVYSIYKLMDLESYNTASGAYSYKVNEKWTNFFTNGDGKDYVTIDATSEYVTWIAAEDDDTVAEFAKKALAYAKNPDNNITSDGTYTGAQLNEHDSKFSNLAFGWYLVDTSMGALCGLTTTNPNASINAKNGLPNMTKQVIEDSTNQPSITNTADIGQIMEYQITINVHAGAENYKLWDEMPNGIKFHSLTKIEHIIPSVSTTEVPAEYYSLLTHPESKAENADIHKFEIQFTQEFCDHLNVNDKIVVYYTAMLTRDAEVGNEKGNVNKAWLTFGEPNAGHKTTESTTTTYTYGIDIVKTDSQNTLIDGAVFKIYDAAENGNEVAVVLMEDGVTYRRARTDETGVEILVKNGKVRVVGFDNGTYYLQEIEAPDGYNKLTERQKFIIADDNLDAIFNESVFSTGSGVHVVNKTGSMLPETGAMGTTLFITTGTMLVMATGVLLVTKKRMSMIQE